MGEGTEGAATETAGSLHPPAPLLEVRDLEVRFRRRDETVHAVRGLSFELAPGEVCAVVGESGSGKSVTAHALARLLPPHAEVTGSIRFEGMEVNGLSRKALRKLRGRGMGYVFQEPSAAINPSVRIGTQIAEVLRLHRPELDDRREAALELFEQVGLRDPRRVFDAYPGELSGGMLQRVIIAMAIAPRPRLLIADEPTTALDVTVERQVIDLLARLREELDLAILLITHNFGIVQGFASRTQVMWQGEIVERGPTPELLERPRHPYTQGLLRCRPILGQPRPRLHTGPSLSR